ncbi:MAG TPA: DUF6516 family protein [Acidimicrobiia bacterium]|nr:DUF6516 family protein [Acidimicrobiia bacterium]
MGRWADSLPGDFAIEVTDHTDGAVIAVTGVLISSGLVVRAWIHVDGSSRVRQYRFHVQDTAGGLVWRHDNHPGHENAPACGDESTSTAFAPGRRFASRPIRSTSS